MTRRRTTDANLDITFPEGVTEPEVRQALDEISAACAKRKGMVMAKVAWPPRPVVKEQMTLGGDVQGEEPAAE